MKYKISEARGGRNRSVVNKFKDSVNDSGVITTKKLENVVSKLISTAILLLFIWAPLYAAWLIVRMFITT